MEKTICNICRYQPETDTLIGTIEDTITLLANNNLQHVFIATRNWYIYLDDIRRYHCIIWEKIIWMICINLPETYLLGWECFPLYTKLSNVQGNPHYYPEVSYQLLYTNQYFLNTTLVLSHIHAQTNTHTHTSLKVLHFRLWTFASQARSFAISMIWNITMSRKYLPQKIKAELKTVMGNFN